MSESDRGGKGNRGLIHLAVSLGFVFGFALGLIPLLRAGLSRSWAIRRVLVAEGLSIATMETAEVLVEVYYAGRGWDRPSHDPYIKYTFMGCTFRGCTVRGVCYPRELRT